MYINSFLYTINIFLIVDKTVFVHIYILLIYLDVMDSFYDEQWNMYYNIREKRTDNSIGLLDLWWVPVDCTQLYG